ncbi:MAG: formyltransferase family protein [Bacteroidales bacterium]|jgi:phosphoribosylglycinamide formyltransferase-1|nr:formyltransferase family protein [Bacteroidales bacterium]
MRKKFAVYCSGNASRILKFYSFQHNNNLKPDLIIYDGQKDDIADNLKAIGAKVFHNICYENTSIENIKRINTYTSETIHNSLIKYDCDYLLCFGDKILKSNLVKNFPKRLINFHPSLLPAFKGLNAIDSALKSNVSFLGNTVHYINESIDEGEIIAQIAMYRNDFEAYEDVLELQFPLIKLVLKNIISFNIKESELELELLNRKSPYFIKY